MPNALSLSAIAQGRLIQIVDDGKAAGARDKLIDRAEFDARLQKLDDSDNSTALTESNRAGGSAAARTALDALKVLARDGYNGIASIPSFTISDGQRLEVFTAYGWSSGNIGIINDTRALGLCRLALADDLDIEKPEWEYSAALKSAITAQLAIFEANADDRTGGERMAATRARNEDLDLFSISLSKAWYFLCSATDDTDQWPELRRYGFNVRKDRSRKAAVVVTPPVNP